LVAAVHLKRPAEINKEAAYEDVGIRSHGSYDYTSISKRYSHGCHRLYNHLAVRLYDFVLRRNPHRRMGQRLSKEVRRFSIGPAHYKIEVLTDGYVFELNNPIPVNTLEGTVLSTSPKPISRYMPKPGVLYGPDAVY
jgi:hypothetical protein